MHKKGTQFEKIGGVTLDYTLYPGEDYYSDGEIENELLSIVQTTPEGDYEKIIRDRLEWPILYHLSSIRGNIVDWIPFTGEEKVLEIGAGPGAITSKLASCVKEVTCVDLSKTRSLINAFRNKDRDNITIKVGNFEDIEPHLATDYDYVFLIGVFEYAKSYFKVGEDAFAKELKYVRRHLKEDGRLVLAIENKLGLKYFAGAAEDHTGRFFDGIEGYVRDGKEEKAAAETFSEVALKKLLSENGFAEHTFYYPYPDYKFMSTLFSERRPPEESELNENLRNFDRDRLLLFDEKKAFGSLIKDNLFSLFANSFLVVTGKELPVIYCKYSNDRAPKYRIRTRILREEEEWMVEKTPLHEEATDHIGKLPVAYGKLKERYENGALSIAPCYAEGKSVLFPYVQGVTLESLLDEALNNGDEGRFFALLDQYRTRCGFREEMPFADYDMTFSNIVVEDDAWQAIDYEWAKDKALSAREMLIRAVQVFFLQDPERRNKLLSLAPVERLYAELKVTADEWMKYTAIEKAFQDEITMGMMSLGELRAAFGKKVITPPEIAAEKAMRHGLHKEKAENLATVQVYFDTGNGYNEKESYFVDEPYQGEGMIAFSVEVKDEVKKLRIDPALCPCLVVLHDARLGGISNSYLLKSVSHNGKKGIGGSILFTTADPNMEWDMGKVRRKAGVKKDELRLSFVIQMSGLPASMAETIKGKK